MPLSFFAKCPCQFWIGLVWSQSCATTVGITGPQSLANSIVFSQESYSFSCVTLPSPSDWELGWCKSQGSYGQGINGTKNGSVLSIALSSEHTGDRGGARGEGLLLGGVPGQQLVWSVVSAASLVEGA